MGLIIYYTDAAFIRLCAREVPLFKMAIYIILQIVRALWLSPPDAAYRVDVPF